MGEEIKTLPVMPICLELLQKVRQIAAAERHERYLRVAAAQLQQERAEIARSQRRLILPDDGGARVLLL